ncbi:MAG: hypothetical protein NVS9B8_08100 [Candidatus Limnocylindrales bacterium]
MPDTPLLVYGPRSLEYDFGPAHPLTPRRFGPGIDLLRAIGAEPGLAPEPARDDELLLCHGRHYLEVVKGFSGFDPGRLEPQAGIGAGGDDPPFPGMHVAAAAVAGGSLRAVEAILRGDIEHAFHPGGGLHHAMPERAAGFCIYNDPAIAIARARRDGLRVLYVDLDVHHGDGVEAIHGEDPGVMTLSFHESGRSLFPGTGSADQIGAGAAAGTVINVPLEPDTGEAAWLAAVRSILAEVAAAFGPDLIVSQHGADSHARDPLAHLRNTTTAMGAAARLVDDIAHREAGGRWLATGGGGYGVYGVVPRSWSLVWLAGAHREIPDRLPGAWLERWSGEAARYGTPALPTTFTDGPNAGDPVSRSQAAAERVSRATAALVRATVVPRLLREAVDRGWWDPRSAPTATAPATQATATGHEPEIVAVVDAAAWERLALAPRVIAPARATGAHDLIASGLRSGARITAAVAGGLVVGLVGSQRDPGGPEELLGLGVAPDRRRRGLAGRLLAHHVTGTEPGHLFRATIGVAERDVIEPLDWAIRRDIARRLLTRAGFALAAAGDPVARLDPLALVAIRS